MTRLRRHRFALRGIESIEKVRDIHDASLTVAFSNVRICTARSDRAKSASVRTVSARAADYASTRKH
jgi:hypothetical protein